MLSYIKQNCVFIALYLIICACNSPYGEYINHKDLDSSGRYFSDIYNNRPKIDEFRTDGYYYRIDSVQVYKLVIFQDTVYRFKNVIDEYRKNPKWGYNIINLGEFTAYYFNYFWIKSNGLCYVPSIHSSGGDFENSNYFVTNDKTKCLEKITEYIYNQIDEFWMNQFPKISQYKTFKGAAEQTSENYNVYYFLGQMELPHYLAKFSIYPENEKLLKIIVPVLYFDKKGSGFNDSTYYFQFHPTQCVPKDRYIDF